MTFLYRPTEPRGSEYSLGDERGAYRLPRTPRRYCSACNRPSIYGVRVPPLKMWFAYKLVSVGDVVWFLGSSAIAVRKQICAEVASRFPELGCGAVEFQPPSTRRRSNKSDAASRPRPSRQLLPELSELLIQRTIETCEPASTFERRNECPKCGQYDLLIAGIEWHESRFDKDLRKLVPVDTFRRRGDGLILRRSAIGDLSIFRFAPTQTIVCTDRFRQWVLDRGLTNIDFWEVGEIVDR